MNEKLEITLTVNPKPIDATWKANLRAGPRLSGRWA
jgi:hypothetical protein